MSALRFGRALWAFCLLLPLAARSATAQERLVRHFETTSGLVPPNVSALRQDAAGFLWIGTGDGLYRFDGIEMRRWAGTEIRGRIVAVVGDGGDGTLVLTESGGLWLLTATGAVPLARSGGEPVRDVESAVADRSGRLWILRSEGISFREPAGEWREPPGLDWGGKAPRRLFRARGDGVFVSTGAGLWRLDVEGPARRVASVEDVEDVLELPDGRLLVLAWHGQLLEISAGDVRELLSLPARGISLAARGTTVWASFDRFLVALRAGEEAEILGPEQGVEGGGPLLVDAESCLWLGTFTGLFQYPEPETSAWSGKQGLPSAHSRYLAETADRMWVATWQGSGWLRGKGAQWLAESPPRLRRAWGRVCAGSDDAIWLGLAPGLARIDRGGAMGVLQLVARDLFCCARAVGDGGLWLGTDQGIFRSRPGSDRLEAVSDLPFDPGHAWVRTVLEQRNGRLWLSSGERVCSRAPRERGWRCYEVAGAVHLTGMAELPSGTVWGSSERLGVVRLGYDRAEPLSGADALPSRSVLALEPAPSGGVWIAGQGIAHRAVENPDGELRIVEHLSSWQGLPTLAVHHVLETTDGSVWLATYGGVVRVPRSARLAPRVPPNVALIDGAVDGRAIDPGALLELPHRRNRLELRFAALSFRDPSLIRMQVRSKPGSAWTDLRGGASFRWIDLAPGRYRAEVRASLDGERWTPEPASFAFRVLQPWYLRTRAIVAYVLAAAALLYGVHRARVGMLLRLERQRTHIAMDLHDEMGSALGTIGVLSTVLRDQEPEGQRRQLADEIAQTAGELGSALADIVWSLRPRPATLQEVAARLAERAERIFYGRPTELTTELPASWPPRTLPPVARRALLLVALEALHNAARHARAGRVVLHVGPAPGGGWEIRVEDDGVGFDPRTVAGAGMGLSNMRRRAEEMGADLEWSTREGGGTVVRIRFDPVRGEPALGELA